MRWLMVVLAASAAMCLLGPLVVTLRRRASSRTALPLLGQTPAAAAGSTSRPPATMNRLAPAGMAPPSKAGRYRSLLEGNVGRTILLLMVVVAGGLFVVDVASGGVVSELGWLLTIAIALAVAGYLAFR